MFQTVVFTVNFYSDHDCNKWRHNSLKFNSILFKLLLETTTDPWIVMITSLDDQQVAHHGFSSNDVLLAFTSLSETLNKTAGISSKDS